MTENDINSLVYPIAGKAFDTTNPVSLAVSNIISSIVYGNRYDYKNPLLHEMVKRAYENMKLTGSASVQVHPQH